MLSILFLLFIGVNSFSTILPNQKTHVILHLEKFNERYNLLHIGISFKNNFKTIRYDYRPFCDAAGCTYETTDINRLDPREIYPTTTLLDTLDIDDNMEKINIYWGESDKTFNEIIKFEKTLHKKYILGVNDCRHYVSKFTEWALLDPTPIWKLNKLWNKYYKIGSYNIDEN
tara:strand:+ start:1646 stop:2161 length:516 start_codon:yes stop_codon:yes gene_type:complete